MWYLLLICFFVKTSFCFGDPLPSWNEGNAKQALLQFVKETTTEGSKNYLSPEDRIATFDQDGTLWVEQPMYTQFAFGIDRVRNMAPNHPEWLQKESYKIIIDGNLDEIKKFGISGIAKTLAESQAGMTIGAFQDEVRDWLNTTVDKRFQKTHLELVYQPMLELMEYLKQNGFRVYIVSGGGQEFMRAYSQKVYNLSPEYIIGTPGDLSYEYKNNVPVLVKLPGVLFVDDKENKPESINLFIGRLPVLAFGNSDGDRQMLEWSQTSPRMNLQLLVHHDDPIREYAYDSDSKIGMFSKQLMEEAKNKRWIVVSMKDDWKVIFPWENKSVQNDKIDQMNLEPCMK